MSDTTTSPLAIFDLDGTLIDTAPDLIATLNHLLTANGCEPLPLSQARTMIGDGAKALLRRGLSAGGQDFDEQRIETLFGEFLKHYGENIANLSRPFDGLIEALDGLTEAGWKFAICTNKLEGLSKLLMDELGLSERFIANCGGDTFPVRKPDPGHIIGTIDRAGGVRERSIMIGDSKNDIFAAQRAGVPVIAVDFGYTDTPVSHFEPDAVISSFDALEQALSDLTSAQGWPHSGA